MNRPKSVDDFYSLLILWIDDLEKKGHESWTDDEKELYGFLISLPPIFPRIRLVEDQKRYRND